MIRSNNIGYEMNLRRLTSWRGSLFSYALLTSLLMASAWAGPPSPELQKARAEYVRLRNIDPAGDSSATAAAWDALAQSMVSALAGASGEEAQQLRLNAADTLLKIWRRERTRSYAEQARELVSPIVTPDGHSPYRAAAFLMRGDIALALGEKRSAVKGWYVRAAALSDADPVPAELARQRLVSLSNGTFDEFSPASELEIPRVVRRTPPARSIFRGTIVLDPGHGGDDSGAVGPGGLMEKEVTLDVARRVRSILEKDYGIRVFFTRESDSFVPLARRTAYANTKHADAFVSLHVNASAKHDGHGLEAYYLDNTDDQASKKLAERENGVVAGESVDDLSFILSDLIQSGKLEDSITLTRAIEGDIRSALSPSYPEAKFLGVKKAPFFVLVGAHMPCSLLEMFFVDHPIDSRWLASAQFRQKLAVSIARAIAGFVGQKSERGMLNAKKLGLTDSQKSAAKRKHARN